MPDEPAADPAALAKDLAAEKARADDLLDKLRRVTADFDNFRKRARKDMDEARFHAREDLLREMLGVLDNFDRALETHGDEEALYHGMQLIFRQFRAILEKEGLERIDAEGHPFNPAHHEAVMREETSAYPDGVIIKELERGYRYRGRVLRPSKVK